jgi:choline dehydrogenase
VLPFFKRIEHFEGGDPAYRGNSGPVNVKLNDASGPLVDALFAAAAERGIAHNPDYNGAAQDGMCVTQASIGNGRRQSTARCYLDPARKRANLTIITDALARELIFDGARCAGVRYAVDGTVHEARAAREVVVSAGAINSPQLLELSGIGQPERLRNLGIEVRHALPGVGENLRDHFAPRLKWAVTQRGLTWNDTMRGLGMVREALRYALTGKGFFAASAGPTRAFVRSREGLIAPDIGIYFSPFLMTPQFRLAKERGLTVITHQLRPESMGSIHVRSRDPNQPPAINFNFLDAVLDRQVTLAAVRISRSLFDTEALRSLRGAELMPGDGVRSDDEILDWIRRTAETAYHPVGTCKMGSDANAVVDERLRVYGVAGLRVADASNMPTLTSGTTNAPSMMIGDKAAAMILEDARI